jgi:hypothetical protein
MSVEHHHFTIEICERAEPKITVFKNGADAYFPLEDAGDQRA